MSKRSRRRNAVLKAPKLTPGARSASVSAHPGVASAQMPTGPNRQVYPQGSAFTQGSQPNRYNEMAGPPPPPIINDLDISGNVYSPFQPVSPFGPPSINYPRSFDYQIGSNIDFTPGILSYFQVLQVMSQTWGILRSVIETRKDQLLRIPWDIQVRDKPKATNPRLDELRLFFKKPDKQWRFNRWMRLILENRFVTDTANYYVWRQNDGKPYALMVTDGTIIKPLIDDAGRRPSYPNPAYQQIIKGLPWQNLDENEFLYAPMRPRPQQPHYGYSEVEQIALEIRQGIAKNTWKLEHWTSGTMPEMIITVPAQWTPQQLASYQAFFDSYLSGNLGQRSKIRFMPSDSKPFDLKNASGEALKTEEDEWVTRLVCYVFSVSPTPFIRQMNRATAESAAAEAEEEGLHPLMTWVKEEIMDPAIQEQIGFGYDDLEFVWKPEPEVDAEKQMTVITGYVKVGLLTPDEGREQINQAPLANGSGAEAVVITPTGPIPFKETLDANRAQALDVPNQLQRTQESHDQKMSPPPPAMPSAAPGASQGQPQASQQPAKQQAKKPPAKPKPANKVMTFRRSWEALRKKGIEDEPRDDHGRWTNNGSSAVNDVRLPGETDKQYAKRVIDQRDAPASLPEDHSKYFNIDEHTKVIPMGDLVSSKSAAENAQGAENGAKRMAAAANGEISRRDPLTVTQRDDGKYVVLDGNGTLSSVSKYNWKALPAKVVNANSTSKAYGAWRLRDELGALFKDFNPDQPRDDHGKWTSGGSSYEPGLKGSGQYAAGAVKKEWAAEAPSTLADHYAVAQTNQDSLDKVANVLGKDTGATYQTPGIKSEDRAQQKVDAGKNPNAINDIVRGGFLVNTPDQADAIAKGLAKSFETADEGWYVTPAGYFDRKVLVRFPGGQVGEVQMWHQALLDAKENQGGHDLYVTASKLSLDDPQRVALFNQQHDLYSKAFSSMGDDWKSIFKNQGVKNE